MHAGQRQPEEKQRRIDHHAEDLGVALLELGQGEFELVEARASVLDDDHDRVEEGRDGECVGRIRDAGKVEHDQVEGLAERVHLRAAAVRGELLGRRGDPVDRAER